LNFQQLVFARHCQRRQKLTVSRQFVKNVFNFQPGIASGDLKS
jgi:hypothetical protein